MDCAEKIGEEERHPAFLPHMHNVTRLFILNQHRKLGHRPAEMVIASLCQDVGVHPMGEYVQFVITCQIVLCVNCYKNQEHNN